MSNLKSSKYIYVFSATIIFVWSIIIFIAGYFNTNMQRDLTLQIVKNIANSNFNKDLAYRKWASSHGGVYVKPTKKTPPNPYLAHIPDRDIVTKDGDKLTLMNPAYMLREMMDEYKTLYGVQGRIVGIKYLNPNNEANKWEAEAIKEFASGLSEKIELTNDNDGEFFRLMKPMVMRESCQKCHGHLGFKNGSIRGGVSISIPMKEYRNAESKSIRLIRYTTLLMWLLGIASIFFITNIILKNKKQKEKDIDELLVSHSVFENILDSIFITDADGIILRVNVAFEKITGFSKEEAVGDTPRILKSGHHSDEFYNKIWTTIKKNGEYSYEIINRKKNGEIFIAIEKISSIKDKNNNIKYFICILHDITLRKDEEQKISHMAHYDALTDLPNRVLFELRLEHALEIANRNNNKLALAYLDIDGFKNVNDTLGHPIGDKLLKEVSFRLNKCVRNSDTIARLGGDEFCIIFEKIENVDKITAIMDKILKALNEEIFINDNTISISASIGISIYPNDGKDIETLVECADIAMYTCKKNGKNNFCFYNKSNFDLSSYHI